MKIAVYQGLPPGGASRAINAITRTLDKKHTVTVYEATRHLGKRTSNRLASDINALVWQRFYQRRLAKKIDNLGNDVCLISHDPYLQSPWLLRYLKTPTVFLCQEPTRAYYEYFLKIPDDLPALNKLYEYVNRYFRKKYETENTQKATAVAVNSLFSVESTFSSYGVVAKNIYMGFDLKEFFPRKSKKRNQIMLVGNDEPQKALDFAIEIVSLLPVSKRPHLIIVSPRPYDDKRLVKIANSKKIKLEIKHNLTNDQVSRLYAESILTLAVSHLEPFGLSAIESMACGTPVVAVNEGGFRETVINGQTGMLVERDVAALAHAIISLVADPAKLKRMGEKGRIHVLKNFTWELTTARLETVLQNASSHHHS